MVFIAAFEFESLKNCLFLSREKDFCKLHVLIIMIMLFNQAKDYRSNSWFSARFSCDGCLL